VLVANEILYKRVDMSGQRHNSMWTTKTIREIQGSSREHHTKYIHGVKVTISAHPKTARGDGNRMCPSKLINGLSRVPHGTQHLGSNTMTEKGMTVAHVNVSSFNRGDDALRSCAVDRYLLACVEKEPNFIDQHHVITFRF
jgi:hypothetical protein